MLIICNGMVRSGSTLQYNLARNIVEKLNLGIGKGFFSNNKILRNKKFSKWLDDDQYYIIKMHAVLENYKQYGQNVIFLYIYRDIRDVAGSLKLKYGREGNELIHSLSQAVEIFEEMKKIPRVLWQRYEDVIIDLPQAASQIAEFLDLKVSEELLRGVAEECSLEKHAHVMHHMQQSLSQKLKCFFIKKILRMHFYDTQTLLHPDHISRNVGLPGSWQRELSHQEIDKVTNQFGFWLEREGYLKSS